MTNEPKKGLIASQSKSIESSMGHASEGKFPVVGDGASILPLPDSKTDSVFNNREAALEKLWQEKFVQQPRLPSEALLTGAVSMAMAFGGVLFLLSSAMRRYAWIWFALSITLGLVNRLLAQRWYWNVVVPWDRERRALAQELKTLREK